MIAVVFTGCQAGWSEEEKAAFSVQCEAAIGRAGDANPRQTCTCLQEKVETKFPNPDELDSLLMKPGPLLEMAAECRIEANDIPTQWSPETEKAFLTSCRDLAKMHVVADSNQCPCVLERVKARYPTLHLMNNVKPAVLRDLAIECANQQAGR